jgi:hypothetical protein
MRVWAWIAAVALLPACPSCGSGSSAISANPTPTSSDNPTATASDPTTASSDPTTTSLSPTTTEALALPARIVCGTQYRPVAESLEGAEEKVLTVERDDLGTNAGVSLEFPTMTITVSYVGDVPDGRVVMIAVTTSDSKPLSTVLYQLGDLRLSEVGFAGDHGFTGLHYVQNRRANLQFWCAAE